MGQRNPGDSSADRPPGVTCDTRSSSRSGGARARSPRLWLFSIGPALLAVGLAIAASALVNPMLGRIVHWRRIDLGAPIVFLGLALALRRRWI